MWWRLLQNWLSYNIKIKRKLSVPSNPKNNTDYSLLDLLELNEHPTIYDSFEETKDFYNGIDDLNNKVLRMIGNPDERLVEDPLRILRAYRFATIYGLTIDKTLNASIIKNKDLLSKLNKEKVKEELNKLLKKV